MVLDTLRGEWALRRNVDPTGEQLIGDADFASTGESALTYRESGILRLRDGRELSASRQYRYCAVGHRVDVQFADGPNTGKLFLNLAFSRKNVSIRAATRFLRARMRTNRSMVVRFGSELGGRGVADRQVFRRDRRAHFATRSSTALLRSANAAWFGSKSLAPHHSASSACRS